MQGWAECPEPDCPHELPIHQLCKAQHEKGFDCGSKAASEEFNRLEEAKGYKQCVNCRELI